MSGFTKLVPEIVQSSLWNEPPEIRCVWIAMIATKDANGYVRGDARTIARMANVSLESAEKALAMFQEPDPSSHTPDNEGRRIMPAPGGWIILNHDIYRAHDDQYRAKNRERVRRFRSKMASSENVTLPETLQTRYPSASASASVSDSGIQGECKGGWTLEQCLAAAAPIGMKREMVEGFWNHYAAVDFVDAAGRKITHLAAALGKWKAKQSSIPQAPKSTEEILKEINERKERERKAANGN